MALALVSTDTEAVAELIPSRVTELETVHIDWAGAPVQLRFTV
jgi:hypothetical protein